MERKEVINMPTSHFMNNKERFLKALLYGLLAAVVCGIVVGYLNQLTAALVNASFPILYPISAYIIAKAIHKAGGGINKDYAYMGAALTVFSMIISEMCTYVGFAVLIHPLDWIPALKLVCYLNFQFQGTGLISWLFMILAVYVGYNESDISHH